MSRIPYSTIAIALGYWLLVLSGPSGTEDVSLAIRFLPFAFVLVLLVSVLVGVLRRMIWKAQGQRAWVRVTSHLIAIALGAVLLILAFLVFGDVQFWPEYPPQFLPLWYQLLGLVLVVIVMGVGDALALTAPSPLPPGVNPEP